MFVQVGIKRKHFRYIHVKMIMAAVLPLYVQYTQVLVDYT